MITPWFIFHYISRTKLTYIYIATPPPPPIVTLTCILQCNQNQCLWHSFRWGTVMDNEDILLIFKLFILDRNFESVPRCPCTVAHDFHNAPQPFKKILKINFTDSSKIAINVVYLTSHAILCKITNIYIRMGSSLMLFYFYFFITKLHYKLKVHNLQVFCFHEGLCTPPPPPPWKKTI